jgi:thermostable 8-oxoguanine DNA glycosylase
MLVYDADTEAYKTAVTNTPVRKFRVINSENIGKDFKGLILDLLYENAFGIQGYHCFAQPLFDNELNPCTGTVCMSVENLEEVFGDELEIEMNLEIKKPEPVLQVNYDGTKCWLLNGELHREDGPAIEYANGYKEWYLNGISITEKEFNKKHKAMSEEVFTDMLEDEVTTDNNAELKAENESGDADIEITDFHPGTVDNPFIYGAKAPELEKFILLNMFVAGKNATIQQKKLDQFIACVKRDIGEFTVDTMGVISAIHNTLTEQVMADTIMGWLQEVKAGQYRRLCAGIVQACERIGSGKINLADCTRKQLLTIKGIGRKTSSMFLMYTKKGWRGACLDTHILKFLREEGGCPEAPLATPSTLDMYSKYENKFIDLADRAGKRVAEYDFEIWSKYRSVPASAPEAVAVI